MSARIVRLCVLSCALSCALVDLGGCRVFNVYPGGGAPCVVDADCYEGQRCTEAICGDGSEGEGEEGEGEEGEGEAGEGEGEAGEGEGEAGEGEGEGDGGPCADDTDAFLERATLRVASCDDREALDGAPAAFAFSCGPFDCIMNGIAVGASASDLVDAPNARGDRAMINQQTGALDTGLDTFAVELVARTPASGDTTTPLVIFDDGSMTLGPEGVTIGGTSVLLASTSGDEDVWHHVLCFASFLGPAPFLDCYFDGVPSDPVVPVGSLVGPTDVTLGDGVASLRVWPYSPGPQLALLRIDRETRIASRRLRAYVGLDVQSGVPGTADERRAAGVLARTVDVLAPPTVVDTLGSDGLRHLMLVASSWPRVVRRAEGVALVVEGAGAQPGNSSLIEEALFQPQGGADCTTLTPTPFVGERAPQVCTIHADTTVYGYTAATAGVDGTFSVFLRADAPVAVTVGSWDGVALGSEAVIELNPPLLNCADCVTAAIEPYAEGWVRASVTLPMPTEVAFRPDAPVDAWWPQIDDGRLTSPMVLDRDADDWVLGPVSGASPKSLDVVALEARPITLLAFSGELEESRLVITKRGVEDSGGEILSVAGFNSSEPFAVSLAFDTEDALPCLGGIVGAQCVAVTRFLEVSSTAGDVALGGDFEGPKLLQIVRLTQ